MWPQVRRLAPWGLCLHCNAKNCVLALQDAELLMSVLLNVASPLRAAPAILTGSHHAAGVSSDGRLYVWGSDSRGQLGRGWAAAQHVACHPLPHEVALPMEASLEDLEVRAGRGGAQRGGAGRGGAGRGGAGRGGWGRVGAGAVLGQGGRGLHAQAQRVGPDDIRKPGWCCLGSGGWFRTEWAS